VRQATCWAQVKLPGTGRRILENWCGDLRTLRLLRYPRLEAEAAAPPPVPLPALLVPDKALLAAAVAEEASATAEAAAAALDALPFVPEPDNDDDAPPRNEPGLEPPPAPPLDPDVAPPPTIPTPRGQLPEGEALG
jgi:hypothetical protein